MSKQTDAAPQLSCRATGSPHLASLPARAHLPGDLLRYGRVRRRHHASADHAAPQQHRSRPYEATRGRKRILTLEPNARLLAWLGAGKDFWK